MALKAKPACMKKQLICFAAFTCILFISCKQKTANSQQTGPPATTNGRVGGGCEGCEAIYESPIPFDKLTDTDTLPGFEFFNDSMHKLLIRGIVYKPDGKTPAPGVVLYIYHTNQQGVYESRPADSGWAKRHGYRRGWVKTDEAGRYLFYTQRPAPYPGRNDPAHIHVTIKEPNINEYWIDEFVFDNDPLLTQNQRSKMENRGSNGILKTSEYDNWLTVAGRDIILGQNIPNYPEKTVMPPPKDSFAWRELPAPKNYYALCNAVAEKGKIYVAGGSDNNGTFEEYDPATNTWTALSPMKKSHVFGGIAAIGEDIYVAGGGSVNDQPELVEQYNLNTRQWTTVASLPSGGRTEMIALNGKLYAFVNKVYEYDPTADKWSTKKDLPLHWYGMSLAVKDNKILAAGGYIIEANGHFPTNELQEYDPAANTWTRKPPMPTKRGFLGAAVINNDLYCFAGRTFNTPVEKFNYAGNYWQRLADIPMGIVNRFPMAFIGNKVYIINGETHPKYQSNKVMEGTLIPENN